MKLSETDSSINPLSNTKRKLALHVSTAANAPGNKDKGAGSIVRDALLNAAKENPAEVEELTNRVKGNAAKMMRKK